MRVLIFSIIFLVAAQAPLCAGKTVFLNDLTKKKQIGYTRLILDFSSLPSCQVKTYGQRVDLHFQKVELGPKFRRLPEDDVIVRVILARNREEFVLSILFRKLPVRVEATPMQSRGQLFVDVHWQQTEGRDRRLAVDMQTQELPRLSNDAKARVGKQASAYAGNWKKFFYDYQAPLQVNVPLRFSRPELPSFPEKLLHGELEDVPGIIRSKGWEVVEDLLSMKAEITPDLKKEEVFQALLLEAGFREGDYKAVSEQVFEPEEKLLLRRSRYLRNFSLARTGRFYLAKSNLDKELEQMEKDDPFLAHVLLLQAEIALACDAGQEALRYLSREGVAWPGALQHIRRLRMTDSRTFEVAPEKPEAKSPITAAAQTVVATATRTVPGATVTVKKGDSWWRLAKRHGTTVAELKKLNNASGNLLQIGQAVIISPARAVNVRKPVSAVKKPAEAEPMNPYVEFLAKQGGPFLEKPYSLWRAAGFYRKQKKPHAALFLMEKAKLNLGEGEAKQLVELSTAHLLKQVGKKDLALERLKFLSEQEPVTDAVLRARLALLEDDMAGDQFFDFGRMAEEYAVAAGQARDRGFREATAFKSALAWYFAGHKERSVASFDAFVKNYSAGSLVGEVKVFLSEVMPPLIEDMVKQGRDFEAVLMLDKHRDILLSHQKDSRFLMHLASSLERLGLMQRAAKIYLFLIDYYDGQDQENFFYLPLVRTYVERREFAAAADFAGRYLQNFPKGRDWHELFYLQMLAFHQAGRLEDAIAVWEKYGGLAGRKTRIVAARVFWKKERYRDVVDCLEAEKAKGDRYPPEILVLKAEACFRTGQHGKACALFKELAAIEKYAQHSLYRCAEIALTSGKQDEALNYLRQVVEKGKEGIWHDLARTSMMEMRM